MLRLVNQILDFRKIQNKKMKLLVEESDIIALLRKITDSFQLVAEEKQIDCKVDTDCKELYIWIDRDKFEKIFFNLLSNAFKYTPSGKAVTVRITTDTENVTISVIDEGIGIDPEISFPKIRDTGQVQHIATIVRNRFIISQGVGRTTPRNNRSIQPAR